MPRKQNQAVVCVSVGKCQENHGGKEFTKLPTVVSGWCFQGILSLVLYLIFFIGELVAKSCLSCPTLGTPWTVACQAPLSMGFSRQEYWSGLPIPSPGDLLDSGIRGTQVDSCIAGRFLYWLSYERSPNFFFFSLAYYFTGGNWRNASPPL